jgi:hypothetical protein
VTLSGNSTLTQAAGATLNSTGDFVTLPNTTVSLNGTFNTTGGSTEGALAINSGGIVNQSGSAALYLDGSQGTTINSGGQINAASGSTIELGGLLVNNGTQTGALNVNLGGLAKGSGSFGTVTVGSGGKFSPGNSPGTATVSGLNFAPGGDYDFEITSANGTPGNGADFIHDTGTLAITAGTTPGTVFIVAVSTLNTSDMSAALTDFNAAQNYSYTLLTADGGITGFAPSEFSVDTSHFENNTQGGAFAVSQSGDSLLLNFTPTAAPEPSQWTVLALGAAGLLGLGWRARRRAA